MTRATRYLFVALFVVAFSIGFVPTKLALAHDRFVRISPSTLAFTTSHSHPASALCSTSYSLKHKSYFNSVSDTSVNYHKFKVTPTINNGGVSGNVFRVGNYLDQDIYSSYFLLTVPHVSGHTYSTNAINKVIPIGAWDNQLRITFHSTGGANVFCQHIDYYNMFP